MSPLERLKLNVLQEIFYIGIPGLHANIYIHSISTPHKPQTMGGEDEREPCRNILENKLFQAVFSS